MNSWIPSLIYEYNFNNLPPGVEPYSLNELGEQSMDTEIEANENYNYVKPSSFDFNKNYVTGKSKSLIKERVLSYDELFHQFYDESKNMLVNSAKDFIAGDVIFVSDKLSSVEYDDSLKVTYFRFLSSDNQFQEHEIAFDGNLTDKYKTGDSINLKFDLVVSYKSLSYEYIDINYNVYIKENQKTPILNDYLF